MRKIIRFSALLLAVGLLALSATPSFAQTGPTLGSIRLVNASPDAPALDIYFNQTKYISNLSFKGITGYTNIPDGTYDVKAFAAPSNGTGTPLFEVPSYTVNSGSVATIVAVGTLANKSFTALPLSDENWLTTADSGKAKVRFIHGSPDAPAVNVSVAGIGDIFNNISYKSVGNYLTTSAGPLNLSIQSVSDPGKNILTQTFNLQAGKVYTIFVVGQVSGTPQLSTVLAVDTAISSMPATGEGSLSEKAAPIVGLNMGLIGLLLFVAAISFAGWKRLFFRNAKKS